MKLTQLIWFSICSILFLPACGPFSKKKQKKDNVKEKSQQQNLVAGSSFVKFSESEIREDVRREYAKKQETVTQKEFAKKRRRLSKKQRIAAVQERARSQEAKLADIPIPLQGEPIEDFFDCEWSMENQAVTLGYNTDMSVEDLAEFYQREMDRYGWRCLSDVNGKETLTSFVKPARVCFVSIRPRGRQGGSDLVISTGPTVVDA